MKDSLDLFAGFRSAILVAGVSLPLLAGAADYLMDDITVTARKTEESVQDIPISVSPFTASKIRDLDLKSTDDIALFTPGLSFTSAFGRQPGSDRPSMRGISTVVNGFANASAVAYFIDGVFLGGSPQSTELNNVERVEVLRGPQAAQFGRGTYVGAINYVTRKAGDSMEGGVEVSAGEDSLFEASAWASGPLSDTVGFYVAAGFDEFDGQYDNNLAAPLGGGKIGGEETKDVTAKLFLNPTDNLDVTLKVGYQETDDEHFAIYLQPRDLNNCCFRSASAPRAREYYAGEVVPDRDNLELVTGLLDSADRGEGSGTELERFIASLTVNWRINDDFELSSLTGFIDDEINTGFDVSYAGYDPIPFGSASGLFWQIDEDEQQDFSQELRLTNTSFEDWTFTGGLYYYEGEDEEIASWKVRPDGSTVALTGDEDKDEIENLAFFGSVDWAVTERLTLGLEMRYAKDELEKTIRQVEDDGSPALDMSGTPIAPEVLKENFYSFTPRVTALYQVNENLNVYANVANGTKPGDFNNSTLCPDLPRGVDEEDAWNYELGLKSSLWDNRANVNIAGYLLEVDDQQLTTVCEIPGTGGGTTTGLTNAGETEVWGIELESTVQLTEAWVAGLTYAYTDAEIDRRISVDQADLLGSLGGAAQTDLLGSVAGNDVPRVPDNQFSLFTRFEQNVSADQSWYVSGTWGWEDSKYSQEHNLANTGARSIVGLRAGYVVGDWEFSVWGKNIFDDDTPVDILRYIDRRSGSLASCSSLGSAVSCTQPTRASSSPRGFALTLPRQRQWGATVNWRFGGGS